MKTNTKGNKIIWASVAIASIAFLIELLSPSGVYTSCIYGLAIIISLFSRDKFSTLLVTILCIVFIVSSIFTTHTQEDDLIVYINHFITVFGLIAIMIFVIWLKTFRLKAEKDNQQINVLYKNATEGIILSNQKGEILLVNPRAEDLFRYKENELKGKKIDILVPMRSRAKHQDHRASFMEKPQNRTMGIGRDLYAVRKDGSEFPVEISLSHYNSDGQKYVVAFIIDITVRKHNEKEILNKTNELEKKTNEIRQLNFDLERKVSERTMMLRETLSDLEKSKQELKESLEKEKELGDLKTRFVSMASHEFRTPLSAILSSTSLIAKYHTTDEQPKRDKHIDRIKENVRHLNSILEDLLSLGKLEEGIITVEMETFNFHEWLQEICTDMKEVIKQGQKFEISYAGNEFISTDKKLLKNILINLLSNASKFSPDDSKILISSEINIDSLILSIKDQGIGISKEDQDHLFERFFRAKNASNIQGTGLGLHIVSKYLELLKGKINLESTLDLGTTFTLTIPI